MIAFNVQRLASQAGWRPSATASLASPWNLLWQYAIRHPGILASSVSAAEIRTTTRQFLFGPVLYVVAFIAAFFSGIASLAINLVVLAMFAFFAAITTIGGRSGEN